MDNRLHTFNHSDATVEININKLRTHAHKHTIIGIQLKTEYNLEIQIVKRKWCGYTPYCENSSYLRRIIATRISRSGSAQQTSTMSTWPLLLTRRVRFFSLGMGVYVRGWGILLDARDADNVRVVGMVYEWEWYCVSVIKSMKKSKVFCTRTLEDYSLEIWNNKTGKSPARYNKSITLLLTVLAL